MPLWDLLKARRAQGTRTIPYPPDPATAGLPGRFRGLPVLDAGACVDGCAACAQACPVGAIETAPLRLDLGRCVFCGECARACPPAAAGATAPIRFTTDWRLAASKREDLRLEAGAEARLTCELDRTMRRLFGRSLKLRQVSAAGCSGCEAELVATGNIIFDLGRFGVQFVASPRHADGMVITGAVGPNMRFALEETYRAIPPPKLVIAVGACAISGGPFFDAASCQGAAGVVPIDLFIPGCPPHPLTILDGLLRLLGKLEEPRAAPREAGRAPAAPAGGTSPAAPGPP